MNDPPLVRLFPFFLDRFLVFQLLATRVASFNCLGNFNKHAEMIGKRVAKDFGSLGVFLGTVMNVEYDSDDATHKVPFYVVEFTDGDREDLNESELEYAMELVFQIEFDEEDELEMAVEKDKQ